MLHDFSSAFWVSSCQDSDQLPTWSHSCPGTWDYFKFKILHSKKLYLKLEVCHHSCSCVCPSFKCDVGHATVAGIQLDPFKIICLQRLFICEFPGYWDRKNVHFQISYSEQLNSGLSVTIMQFNQVFRRLDWIALLSDGTESVPSDNISLNSIFFLKIELLLPPH